MIYFDNSATTAIDSAVLDTYIKTSQRIVGNPSSLHRLGNQAIRLVEQSRHQIANLLGVAKEEIFFTSGGTEGDNWIVKGTAMEKRKFGKHIIISAVEHPAVKESADQLTQLGFEVTQAPVDKDGFVNVKKLIELIRKDTILVSIMAVNNEVGSIQPIKEIGESLSSYPTLHFHVDAVQAVGQIPLEEWLTDRVDFATFSSHKFHGPRGMGFIYNKKGKRLAPLLNGGGQEKGQRSTTENVAGITATAKALRLRLENEQEKREHIKRLQKYLYDSLKQFKKVTLFSNEKLAFAPHILCFAIQGVKGEALVHAFENKDIFISTTSACSSKQKIKKGTLQAMGVTTSISESAVRVSFADSNTMTEVEQFMIVFRQLYERFSKITT